MDKALAETIGEDFEQQLAAYRDLAAERDAIRERLQKAQGERESVKDHIFQRVSAEYETRLQGLDVEMRPLADELERAAARLSDEVATIDGRMGETQDRLEELNFRHRVGEFADEELGTKQGPLQTELDELTERRRAFETKLEDIRGVVGDSVERRQSTDATATDAEESSTAPADTAAPAASAAPATDTTPQQPVEINETESAPETHEPAATAVEEPAPASEPAPAPQPETNTTETASADEPVELSDLAEPMNEDSDDPNYGRRIDDTPVSDAAAGPDASADDVPAGAPTPPPAAVVETPNDYAHQNLIDPTDWVDELIDAQETPGPHNNAALASALEQAKHKAAADTNTGDATPERREASPEDYPVLIITKGPGSGRKLPLLPMTMTMGREHDNNIEIKDEEVARYHARISFQRGKYVLEDLESASGTWVNDERINEVTLAHGDQIRVGGTEMTIAFSTSGAISS